jgi:hypothetical protein
VGNAIDADQFRRHPLTHFRIVVRLAQNGEPRMRMQIDKARTDNVVSGIDDLSRFQVRRVATVDGHPFVLDQHRGMKARATTAVDDQAVLDQYVEHSCLPSPMSFYAPAPGEKCAGLASHHPSLVSWVYVDLLSTNRI